MPRFARFILDNSLLLLAGTVIAVAWANVDVASYDRVTHPLHFWVNDVGMVFFFALAAKEVFEATLPGGSLSAPRQALLPLAAAVGGMAAPAVRRRLRTGAAIRPFCPRQLTVAARRDRYCGSRQPWAAWLPLP